MGPFSCVDMFPLLPVTYFSRNVFCALPDGCSETMLFFCPLKGDREFESRLSSPAPTSRGYLTGDRLLKVLCIILAMLGPFSLLDCCPVDSFFDPKLC